MKKITMIGNAHLDPVWLWQWQEGLQEVKATFQSALDRMNENEDFIFTCACAAYYKWVEENAPDMFEEIRQRVAEGRWVLAGGMWIQPDMNTPSGESFSRQLLYSQRYFLEKFGRIATFGYNVDSFGHNAALPQLYTLAGIRDYVWMRPSMKENPRIPQGAMLWEGIDGTSILTFRIFDYYNHSRELAARIDATRETAASLGQPAMCFYGVGNHGGGPTIENLRQIRAYQASCEGGDEVVLGAPDTFFAQLREEGLSLPTWRGELQHHASGCYSTHSASKRLHRQAENSLLRMEKLSVLSHALTGHETRSAFVQQAWEDLMFNEFHDIMGGCAIRAAMEDCEVQLHGVVSIAEREENALLQRISWQVDTSKGNPVVRSKEDNGILWGIRGQGTPVVVFNPHPFPAEGTVQIRYPIRTVRDDDGAPVPAQEIRAERINKTDMYDGIFRASVPALGYRVYWVFREESEPSVSPLRATTTLLENDLLRAELSSETGALLHLIDKRTGFDALAGASSARLMDVEECDTWAHYVFRFDKEAGAFGEPRVTLLESGPVRAVLEVETRTATSTLRLRYILYAEADQLEVEVLLDMHEHYRMLKLCFPTAGTHDVSEISCGALPREGNGEEEHCQRWVAAQGESGGLAILNDGRYSYSMDHGELRMTLSNTSLYADHYGQPHRDHCVEWMDQGEHRLRLALLPYAGSWRDAELNRRAEALNQSMPYVVETYHKGSLPGSFTGLEIDNSAVALGALKPAEDGKGLVLRLCEVTGEAQYAHVELPVAGRALDVELAPFEIKTLLLPHDRSLAVRELLLTELEGRSEE